MLLPTVSLLCLFSLTASSASFVQHAYRDPREQRLNLDPVAVTSALNGLVAADTNHAADGDITVDYQNMASHSHFDHDNAPNPLFSSISPALLAKPTFAALSAVIQRFVTPDVDTVEPTDSAKTSAIDGFLSSVIATDVGQKAWQFLQSQSIVSSDANAWKTRLSNLWFDGFARHSAVGSSGFEAVFVGETDSSGSPTTVGGLNSWQRVAQLEASGQLNYHGWFQREKDFWVSIQFAWGSAEAIENSIWLGTSPEFDFFSATVCALSGLQTCSLTVNGQSFTLHVDLTPDGKISSAFPTLQGGGSPSGTTPPPSGSPQLQSLVNDMWALDQDKAGPGDIQLDWGNKVKGTSDTSPNKLFTYVSPSLLAKPIYQQLMSIYNQSAFTPDVCVAEPAVSGFRRTTLQNLLDTFTGTPMFAKAYNYLVSIGKAPTDMTTFKAQLFQLWYGYYSRCGKTLGSSGFEHVYSGEWRNESGGPIVDGLHNWVRYYLLEQSGDINYHGYYVTSGQLIGTFQFTWLKQLKQTGGFFIGTSPGFDFAILTVCALSESGSKACRFQIEGYDLNVTSYTQACADGGTCLSTDYPSDE